MEGLSMETKLTKLLEIEYPIIQGAMAWVSDGQLAAGVSKAGGAGTIAASGRSVEWVKDQIRFVKERTDKPFGVNVMLMADNHEEIIDLVCSEKLDYVTLGAGNPIPYLEKLHRAGIKAIPVVPNTKLAKRVEDNGADALVIEGMEAGGHIGKLTTMALMTQVIPQIDIPVIAAGGFVDKRGLAAALAMGAAGIQMGTRFYASRECTAKLAVKEKIIESIDTDTVVTGRTSSHSVRGIRNKMSDKYLKLEREGATKKELNELAMGSSRAAPQEGDIDWGFIQAGQSLGEIKNILSCKSIIQEIVEGFQEIISDIHNKFV
jgi:enoyl-[acyl-carrier protein] reductase II